MLHTLNGSPGQIESPLRGGTACGTTPSDHVSAVGEVGPKPVRGSDSPRSVPMSLSRLDQLAPQVSRELHACWGDPHLAGRLMEELLGGERGVTLQTEAIIELIKLYQSLEGHRAASDAQRQAHNPSCAT